MPQDANCPACKHIFPVTEARQAFTVACPKCDADLTVEFKKPADPPEAGQPPYDLLVKQGALPGAGPPPVPKRKPADEDDDEPKRKGGSAMIVLLSGGLGLLFVLGGLGLTGWFLFTQVDVEPTTTTTNRPSGSSGNKGGNTGPKGITGPKGGNTGPKGTNNPPPGWPGGDPGVPAPPKEVFDLKPVAGPAVQITPPELPADPSNVDLGGKVGAVSVGGGGRYIVMHFPDKGQLGVFDTSTAQVDFTAADTDSGVQLAAGLSRLVVRVPSANIFRVYALPGLKKQFDASVPVNGLKSIAMGSRTNGPVVCVGTWGDPHVLELSATGMREIEEARKERSELHGGMLRAAPDGTAFSTFDGFRNNQRTTLLTFENRKWKVQKDVAEVPFPGGDGNFYGNGVVMNRSAQDQRFGGIGAGSNQWYVPAVSGNNYFLKVAPTTVGTGAKARKTIAVTVHVNRSADAPAVATNFSGLPEFEGLIDRFGNHPAVAYDQHLFLVPEAKLLVTLTHDKTKLVLRRVETR